MADSVLSRGISRYQYFMGKWHARLVAVVGTFVAMGLLTLAGSFFLFNQDLHLGGSLMALVTLVAFLAVVTTCGVTVSAISNSTVLGIAVLWLVLYGVGFALSFMPAQIMTPVRVLDNLPNILHGYYDTVILGKLIGWSALSSVGMASIGLVYFSRRDV
jgi:ABC-type transport system involved in multi-copper enzyme maturation permease subunit